MTGPFGEVLHIQPTQYTEAVNPTQNPNNTTQNTSYSYVGQYQKMTDSDPSPIMGGIIQMGARVYIPALGRFLQMNPVEGGTDNNYVYANDPVNQKDLDGKWSIGGLFNSVVSNIEKAIKSTASQLAGAGAYMGAWLFGGGKSRTIPASTYTWTNPQSPTFNTYKGNNGDYKIESAAGSIKAGTLEGYLVVNGASANLTGTLKVSSNKWSFSGYADNIKDTYDFDWQESGSPLRNTLSFTGGVFGAVCSGVGYCNPQNYDIYLPGRIDINGSGEF